jgi:hypothetical protein
MTKAELAAKIKALEATIRKDEDRLRPMKPRYRPVAEQDIQALKFRVAALRELVRSAPD